MRNFGVITALMGLAVLGACGSPGADGGADAAKQDAPVVEVTARDLSAAFQENEAKAQLAYEGKRLQVSGRVKDVDLDMMDQPVVKLVGSGEVGGMGVTQDGKITDVSISGLSKEAAAAIDKGKDMTFLCSEISEVLGGPMVGGCAVATAK
ncbi:hypothetical protein [Sphingomonas sp.]|uniref:OB-fold protein n=1 Tax=Sphingomonas sp. TaxID=28214 RepID=UPI00307EEF11